VHSFEAPDVPPEVRIHIGSILDSQAKQTGYEQWKRLGDFDEFAPQGSSAPPPVKGESPVPATTAVANRWLRLLAATIDGMINFLCMLPTLIPMWRAAFEQISSGQVNFQAMVALGNKCGVNTRALLTNMDTPLGRAAGNWLEVKEAVACLEPIAAKTPGSQDPLSDLRELVLACATQLLVQTGKAETVEAARAHVEECLASGKPRQKWDEMIVAQGAALSEFNGKLVLNHTAPVVSELRSSERGYVSRCDARLMGEVIRDLGGGRMTRDSAINYDVGLELAAKPGESVAPDSLLARVHAASRTQADEAVARVKAAFHIAPEPPAHQSLISEIILPEGENE